MTEQEAIATLNAIPRRDAEHAHAAADQLLVDFLRSNGHAALADAYDAFQEDVGFWYA
jgi:hypothetical protein